MHGFLRAGMLGLLGLVWTATAWADIPPPPDAKARPRPTPGVPVATKTTAPVVVKHADLTKEGKGVQAKIEIPRKLLALVVPAVAPEAAPEKQSSIGNPRSIIAGVVLSLAAVSLVFVARGSKLAKGTAAAGLIVGVVLVGSSLMADIRVPGQPYNGPARRPMPVPDTTVILEVIEDGDSVVLTLPGK